MVWVVDSLDVVSVFHLGDEHGLLSVGVVGVGEGFSALPLEDARVSWGLCKFLGTNFEVVAVMHDLIVEGLSLVRVVGHWEWNSHLVHMIIDVVSSLSIASRTTWVPFIDSSDLEVVLVFHLCIEHGVACMGVISIRQWLSLLPLENTCLVSWHVCLSPEV